RTISLPFENGLSMLERIGRTMKNNTLEAFLDHLSKDQLNEFQSVIQWMNISDNIRIDSWGKPTISCMPQIIMELLKRNKNILKVDLSGFIVPVTAQELMEIHR
ncbi:hypothetical protein PFISCL1PPCAC_24119, partial [Pristionchus fissidentatus]